MQPREVAVLGAGMVGVCSALALQAKGFKVCLIDSKAPGEESSFGNAGMITPSSLLPINNPNLIHQLPTLLKNKSNGFRYKLPYTLRQIKPLSRFIRLSSQRLTAPRIAVLQQLIEQSSALHSQYASAANCSELLRKSGWLRLYRQRQTLANAQYERNIFCQYEVATTQLDRAQLREFAPALKDIFEAALFIEDAVSVASPGLLVKRYADLFARRGGVFLNQKITTIKKIDNTWQLTANHGERYAYPQLVIAAGPWSKSLLTPLGINLPMLFERGAHREYLRDSNIALQVPIHDVEGGYVLTPVDDGIRITCGVELSDIATPYSMAQMELAQRNATTALDFNSDYRTQWQGARPTLPDSMPAIGPTQHSGLWLNTGHQHIGFSTGPASGEILAQMMTSTSPLPSAFLPQRFGL